ncbi:EamA family transporter RarD [Okibacterium endophyticum]
MLYAVGAYGLWGVLPLYFIAALPTGAVELVALRIVFSLVFCAILIAVTRAWTRFAALLKQPKILFTMALAGVLIFINWQTYIYGALSGQVVEASLGYFINPIVTVLLGVILLRERLRPVQWIAIGIGMVAVIVLTAAHGSVPWIALTLAFSFGFYGYIKKRVGPRVDAISGLTLETAWLTPVAIVQLVVVAMGPGLVFGTVSTWHTLLLIGTGVVTALPLLLFAAASRRLPLIYMGFIQFFAPLIQFIIGVAILHEPMPTERWVGFGLVWVALVVLMVDMVVHAQHGRRRVRS